MKRMLCAAFCLIFCLSGCGNSGMSEEKIRNNMESTETFTAHIKILSDLEESVMEYELDYVYNKEDSDTFTITAPESLAGIAGSIAGIEAGDFALQYDDVMLDDAMPLRTGLTPADGFFCLLSDIRYRQPVQVWSENAAGQSLTVLRYEYEQGADKIAKQVWMSEDGSVPVCAELFANGKRVLTIQVMSFQKNASE